MQRILIAFFLLMGSQLMAQNIYDPQADAQKELAAAVKKAKLENKHVLVQVGGNWCGWCKRMEALFESESEMKQLIDKNYVRVHLNYSPENKNAESLAQLDYPHRFGFPVLVVLDESGERIHTQNSALLESGKGYDNKKIINFLKGWTPTAVDPASYK